MESILTSIKKLLGITEDYEHFDTDIIMYINSALMTLTQLGVGSSAGFSISDKTARWDDFIPSGMNLESIKTYVYIKVKLLFDPPLSSAVMECMKQMASECEWRINHEIETNKEGENQNE